MTDDQGPEDTRDVALTGPASRDALVRVLGVVVAMSGGVIKVPRRAVDEAMNGTAVVVLQDEEDDTYMAVIMSNEEARKLAAEQGIVATTGVDPKKLN